MFFSKFILRSSLSVATLACAQQLPIVSLSVGASCACTQLSAQYGGLVLYSNSTNYTTEVTDYWDVRADLLPECVFLPTNADQVANAVSLLASCGSQFAIRGGGHMNVNQRSLSPYDSKVLTFL
jgi:hypothetical protein